MSRYFQLISLLIIAVLVATIFTWPFILNLTTYYKDTGDYALVGWMFWYNYFSIISGRIFDISSYVNSTQYYPFPYSFFFSETLPIPSVIFFPFYHFTKQIIFSTNFYAFLSFILSFLSSFLVIKYFTREDISSFIGALVFTFNPITYAHFAGEHLQLLNKFFLPPLLLFAFKYFSIPNFKNSLLFYLFFTLNALSEVYFQLFSVAILPLFFIPFAVKNLMKKNYFYFLNLFKSGLAILVFLPLLMYFNLPYLEFSKLEGVVRQLNENRYFSARLIDYLTPLNSSFLYSDLFDRINNIREQKDHASFTSIYEHTLFLNVLPPVLAMVGFYYLLKRKKYLIAVSFGVVLLGAFIYSLGPYFIGFFGEKDYFKLPFLWFYNRLIIFQSIRVPTRFEFILYVPLSIFIAYGVLFLTKIRPKLNFYLLLALLTIIFVENANLLDFTARSKILSLVTSLQREPDLDFLKNKTTIHIPIYHSTPFNEVKYLNWATQTGETTFNGYSGYIPADWAKYGEEFNLLDSEALTKIKALGIDYLIIHKEEVDSFPYQSQAQIFEDGKILIIDVAKLNINVKPCDRARDLHIESRSESYFVRGGDNPIYQLFPKISIRNQGDCILVNKYLDRYQRLHFYLGTQEIEKNIKLPILMEPGEEITF